MSYLVGTPIVGFLMHRLIILFCHCIAYFCGRKLMLLNPFAGIPIGVLQLLNPQCEETGFWDFRPGLTQTDQYSLEKRLEARNFGFKKKRDFIIRVQLLHS